MPELLDQVLDAAQPIEFFARVQPHAADRARGPHQPQPLVLPQRLRVHAQRLGGHADEKEFVVHVIHLRPAQAEPCHEAAY